MIILLFLNSFLRKPDFSSDFANKKTTPKNKFRPTFYPNLACYSKQTLFFRPKHLDILCSFVVVVVMFLLFPLLLSL